MEETICSIEITRDNDLLKAKVQSDKGKYREYQTDEMEYLIERIYDDIQMEIEEDLW